MIFHSENFAGESVVAGIYDYAIISDLHCGSAYFDYPALRKILHRLSGYSEPLATKLLILGDVLEGKMNHRAQAYEALPIDYQTHLAAEVLERIIDVLRPEEVIILPGNHDRKYSIDLLDDVVSLLSSRHNIRYFPDNDYAVIDNVLALHGIERTAGSDYTALTPLIMNNLVMLAAAEEKENKNLIHLIALGHYHRSAIINYLGYWIAVSASFQLASRPLRNDRSIMFVSVYEPLNSISFYIVREKATSRQELVRWWRERLARAVLD